MNQFFYVSAIEGSKCWLVSGPYPQHRMALDAVDPCRKLCEDRDPRSAFMAFGTCGSLTDIGPGVLQAAGVLSLKKRRQNPWL